MSIGVIATIPVQEGKNDEFEAVFMELASQVLANEPGCILSDDGISAAQR